MKKNQKINKTKKAFFATILTLGVYFFAFAPQAKAYVAWPDIIGFNYKQTLEIVWQQVNGALVSSLKREAAQLVADTTNNLISGVNQAGALFITDWEDYLFRNPDNYTRAYMNDFFTITTRGKTYGNYNSTCGNSFSEWRTARAKNAVESTIDLTKWQTDYEEIACSYAEMFNDGTWAAYAKATNPNNNPIAYTLFAESEKANVQQKKEAEARVKAQSYLGFKEQRDGSGNVITPGSLIQGLSIEANSIDMKMIANAHNVGEVAGIVAGKIAGNVIKQGIGNIRKEAQANINNSICDASQSLRDGLRNLTPSGSLLGNFGIGSLGRTRDSRCVLH